MAREAVRLKAGGMAITGTGGAALYYYVSRLLGAIKRLASLAARYGLDFGIFQEAGKFSWRAESRYEHV
jgi:hypothetical protein